MNITDIYGGMNRATMQKMVELTTVDMSGCTDFEPSEFIDGILKCCKIEKLEIAGCKQFTEHNIIDICTSLPELIYFDASKCAGLQYANAHVILCNARKLRVFKVEMRYPEFERKDWIKLKATFPDVIFGEEIENFLHEN